MTTILLTGIPGVGKTGLVEVTQGLAREYCEQSVLSISMSFLVGQAAFDRFRTPPDRICLIDPEMQATLRYGAISEAGRRLALQQDQHAVVDTPMTMYARNGKVLDHIFTPRDISVLDQSRTLDYIVTVLEDPHLLATRMQGLPYPNGIHELLNWMAAEVQATDAASKQIQTIHQNRHVIIPRNHSDETLVKLLSNHDPRLCYLLRPISHVRFSANDTAEQREQKKEDRSKIQRFQERLQEYTIVIAPMELADTGVTAEERQHTMHRDLQWFVATSDLVIAYFPRMYVSEGVREEMRATLRSGKPLVLIHPQADQEVFGITPTLYFNQEEDFFAAVHASAQKSEYHLLREFMDEEQDVPRYAHLRKYAVAIDLQREGKHLLQKQGPRKQFAGKWMLVAGKKEPGQNDFSACPGEAWEEVGARLLAMSKEYRILPVDYADPNPHGSSVSYVRIYTAQDTQWQGVPINGCHTDPQEIAEVGMFTPNQVLAMGERNEVVPATLRYFKELKL